MVNNTLVKQIKLKYTGKTREAASGNTESCKQQFLQYHFSQDDHHEVLEYVKVKLIDKTEASDPTKREYLKPLMSTFKTLYPDGLNFENDY